MYVTSTIDWAMPGHERGGDLERGRGRDRNHDQGEPDHEVAAEQDLGDTAAPDAAGREQRSEDGPDAVGGKDQRPGPRPAPRGRA